MTIKNTLYALATLLAVVGVIALSVLVWKPEIVKGAVAVFSPATCYTAAATSTPTHIASGATSSPISCGLGLEGSRSATLQVIYAASTTAAQLLIFTEYSMDGITWFEDELLSQGATTTSRIGVNTANRYSWQFASSTDGQPEGPGYFCFTGQISRGDCDQKIMNIPTPTQYVRYYFVTVGGAADVWADLRPRTEVN